jgi:DNA-binding CsgD family transcriptional regulator
MRSHSKGRRPYPGLTPGEEHVLEHLREGLTYAEIAYRLGISPDGVKYHVSNMLAKLDLPDRYALAKWEPRAARTGWMARLSGWLPVMAIPKVAGVVLGGAAVLAAGAGVALAVMMLSPSGSDAPAAEATAPVPGATGLAIESVSATPFETTIVLNVSLPNAIPDGSSLIIDGRDLHIMPNTGSALDASSWLDSQDPRTAEDRKTTEITLKGGPLPANTTSLDVTVDAVYVVPANGGGTRHPGPWHGTASVTIDGADSLVDLTDRLPSRTVDTGYGWQYVIDSLQADATTIHMTYHVEGAVDHLASLSPLGPSGLADSPAGVLEAPFPSGRDEATVEASRKRGASSVKIEFGGAARAVLSPATVEFERDGDSWTSNQVAIAAHSWNTRVGSTTHDGEPFVAVSTDAALLLAGASVPLGLPTLADNLGNNYVLGFDSSNYPSPGSTWDFNGPVDPAASTLTFTIQGYADVEEGDWGMDVPLPQHQ